METNEDNDQQKPDSVAAEEKDIKEKYLYLLAEVENYKKAKEKEVADFSRLITERIMSDMLKVLDDFESVMTGTKDEKVESLYKSLFSVLESYGLSKMDVEGKDYSPEIAEAVATEKSPDKVGKIISIIQTGYKLRDRIIRYPKVKIGV